MASAESFLWEVVSKIEPTALQKAAASRSHNHLRGLIQESNLRPFHVRDFLAGSYARDTALRPIDDVDVVVVVQPTYWNNQTLGGLLGAPPDPEKVLNTFANIIRYRYPVSSVYGQRRSVRLQMEHLDIDVVPAIVAAQDQRILKIPDSSSNTWILSAPEIHAQIATDINKNNSNRLKPLIKLLKYWNSQLPSTANFKSFAIETIAVRLFQTTTIASLQDGLLKFFDFIAFVGGQRTHFSGWQSKAGISFDWFICEVPDIAGTGSNTTADVDSTRKSKFVEHAVRSRGLVLEGLNSTYDNIAVDRIGRSIGIN